MATIKNLQTFSSGIDVNSNVISNLADPVSAQDAATRAYVLANAGAAGWSTYAATQNVDMDSFKLINVLDPTSAQDAATKNYVDTSAVLLTGTQTIAGAKTFSSAPAMSGANIQDGTIPLGAVSGTAMNLSGTQTVAGDKTFSATATFTGAANFSACGTLALGGNAETVTWANGYAQGYVLTTSSSGRVSAAPASPGTGAFVQTHDASAVTWASVNVPEGQVAVITGFLAFDLYNTSNGGGGQFFASAKNVGGVAALVGTPWVLFNTNTVGPDLTIDVDGSNNLRVRVSGIAATTLDWNGYYSTSVL